MRNEFTAIYELDDTHPQPRYIAYCPEIPTAAAQGQTLPEARTNLTQAIRHSLQQRREKTMRELLFDLSPKAPPEAAPPTFLYQKPEAQVRNEFTAIIERGENWYIAYCLELPGANGQGKTREDVLENLAEALLLLLEDRREDGLRGVPPEAIREIIEVQ